MVRKKQTRPERNELVARIVSCNRSYFISRNELHERRTGDEAIIEIVGTIERIGKKHEKLLGAQFEASLICAEEYGDDEAKGASATPALFGVSFKGGCASLLAYLPAAPFWALPQMIEAKDVTHIEAVYGQSHYGDADLESLYFANGAKLSELEDLR